MDLGILSHTQTTRVEGRVEGGMPRVPSGDRPRKPALGDKLGGAPGVSTILSTSSDIRSTDRR